MSRSVWCLMLAVALCSVPAAAQVRGGVQVGPNLPQPGPWTEGGSSPGFVNFDDSPAPCGFSQTVAVTSEFAAFGVTFSGPGGNDGGAVLDECSNFGVTGQSSPNFLAFNLGAVLMDGGTPQGPETMTFTPVVNDVTMSCGAGLGVTGTATLECFDGGGGTLGSDTINISDVLQPLTVTAPDIVSCVLSYATSPENILVCDDLVFAPIPVELIEFEVD